MTRATIAPPTRRHYTLRYADRDAPKGLIPRVLEVLRDPAAALMRHGVPIIRVCLGVLGLLAFLAALSLLSACSAGPQLPIVTTPITITCSWTNADGGVIEDNDCMVDRATSSSAAETTGNRARDVTVSPEVTTSVSALP